MRKFILSIVLLIAVGMASAQHIEKDSLLISYTLPQLEAMYNSQGIPPSVLGLKYGIKVYKVIFNTLTYDSLPTTASGLMIFPDTQEYCKMPILSYQHGTTVRKKDVPSRLVGQELLIVYAMASSGLACTMPDYHGMGDGPGYHPYQNARTEAFSVIDIIRAIKEKAPQLSITLGEKLFLVGYSQGGHATMAAHRMIQEKLSGEMAVTASAPMSGAYDMSGIQTDLMLEDKPYSDPFYLPYLIFGNNPIFHFFNSPSDILRVPYDTALPPVMNGIASGGQINARMNDTVKLIFRQDVLDSFTNNPNHFFRNFLKENDVYEWVPQAPVRLHYCTLDEKVPYQNSIKAYNYFKSHGAPDVDTVNGGPQLHTDCALTALLTAKNWFQQFLDLPIAANPSIVPQINTNSGSISLHTIGGVAPLSYSWSTGATTDSIAANAGKYTCTITDANGCVFSDTFEITFSNSIIETIAASIVVYPIPASDEVHFSTEKNIQIENVMLFNLLGKKENIIYDARQQTMDLSGLAAGVYIADISAQGSKILLKIVKK